MTNSKLFYHFRLLVRILLIIKHWCEIGSSLKLQVGFNNSINKAQSMQQRLMPPCRQDSHSLAPARHVRLRLNGRWGRRNRAPIWRSRQYGPNMPIRRAGSRYPRLCIWLRVENQLKRAKFRMEIQDAVGGAKRSIKIEFRT